MNPALLALVLTPHGHLSLAQEDDALALGAEVAQRLQATFARGAGHGLLQLGASEVGTALPAVFSFWREFAARYVTALCTHPSLSSEAPDASDTKTVEAVAPPPDAELEWLAMAAPLMTGAEYLTSAALRRSRISNASLAEASYSGYLMSTPRTQCPSDLSLFTKWWPMKPPAPVTNTRFCFPISPCLLRVR